MSQQQTDANGIESTSPSVVDNSAINDLRRTPDVSVFDLAAVQQPGQVCTQLSSASQTNAPTIIIATSREVAAGVDRIAKRPIKELTERGARPYRLPEGLRTADDRLVVQRHNMSTPAVELLPEGDINLMWEDTTVEISTAHTIGDHAADLPDGVFFASENQETWDIESPDDGHVKTVDSTSEFDASYTPIHNWVEPTQVSYRSEITIYYLDQTLAATDEELHLYQPARTSENSQNLTTTQILSATFDEFIEQTTVSADSHIAKDDLLDCYQQWLPNGEGVSKRHFAQYFSQIAYETERQGKHERLCNRTWRYVQSRCQDGHEK